MEKLTEDNVVRVGGLFDKGNNPQAGRVYSTVGLCPTLDTKGGGYREPLILEKKEASEKHLPTLIGGLGEKKSNNGTQFFQQDRVYSASDEDVAMALPSQIAHGSYLYLVKEKSCE